MKKIGDIIAIPLGNQYSFAQYVGNEDYAFFNMQSSVDQVSLESVIKNDVLFIAAVDTYAIKTGLWKILGNVPVGEALKELPPKYVRDIIDRNRYYLVVNDQKVPVSAEECQGLEVMASWSPEQMQDRLRDHFAGRPNKWLESIK